MSEFHHGMFSLVLYSLDVPTKLMAKVMQHVKALGNQNHAENLGIE